MAASVLYRNGAKLRTRQRLLPPARGQRRLNRSQGRDLVRKDLEEDQSLEALAHLFFDIFDVGKPVPTSDIAVFTGTSNSKMNSSTNPS